MPTAAAATPNSGVLIRMVATATIVPPLITARPPPDALICTLIWHSVVEPLQLEGAVTGKETLCVKGPAPAVEVNEVGVGAPIVHPLQNAGPPDAQPVPRVIVDPSAFEYVNVHGTVAVEPWVTVKVSGHVMVPAPDCANAGAEINGTTENMPATSKARIDALCSLIAPLSGSCIYNGSEPENHRHESQILIEG
jgi:hypothetical protein